MNIFVLDKDINKCVKYMVDKHIVKMITETAQILSSAYYFTGQPELARYRKMYVNHPCCVWVRQSLNNWLWLKKLGVAMYKEYKYRYGDKEHKSGEVILQLETPHLPKTGLTKNPLCMPEKFKTQDVVQSYRAYYNGEKRHIFKWTKRKVPYWIKEQMEELI